jgi:hypothetical protein
VEAGFVVVGVGDGDDALRYRGWIAMELFLPGSMAGFAAAVYRGRDGV